MGPERFEESRTASGNRSAPVAFVLLLSALAGGCGINTAQRQDIVRWEAEATKAGHPEIKFQEDLDPGRAAGLGFLPFGIGGFYVHRPGLGVSGILCWPLSITWVPAVAYKSANEWNYEQLRHSIRELREAERAAAPAGVPAPADAVTRLERIERLRKEGKISDQEYQDIRGRLIQDLGN